MKINNFKISFLLNPIIIILLIIVLIKLNSVEEKIESTNKLLFKDVIQGSIDKLNQIQDLDIVIGSNDSLNPIFVYLKYGCSACEEYYKKVLKLALSDSRRVVFRFLAHPSRGRRFKMTTNAYIANSEGRLLNYMDSVFFNSNYNNDFELLKTTSDDLNDYVIETARIARSLNVNSTPTTFVKGKKIVGTIDYIELQAIESND